MATDTLRESTDVSSVASSFPIPFILATSIVRVHARRTFVRSPAPSLPITSTEGLSIL